LHLGGIKAAPSAPAMNHLLFADDNLFFFKGSSQEAEAVSNLLESYCQAEDKQG
jgi:hypothetical protein